MTLIRHVEEADIGALGQMGRDFYERGVLPGRFDEDHFSAFWHMAIENERGIIIIMEEGGATLGTLGALLFEDPNNGDTVAMEAFWWVTSSARGKDSMRLLDAYEAWAKARGAVRITITAISGLREKALGRVYEGRGYRGIDINYIKEL